MMRCKWKQKSDTKSRNQRNSEFFICHQRNTVIHRCPPIDTEKHHIFAIVKKIEKTMKHLIWYP